MFGYKTRFKQAAVGMSLAAMLAVGAAIPALADDSVSGTITGGNLTASVADLDLGTVAYSHVAESLNGNMQLSIDDQTGTGAGWHVTVQASAFAYDNTYSGGTDIPAANFTLGTIAEPTEVAGQTIDAENGPKADIASNSASLDAARRVVFAEIGYGSGAYAQTLPVDLEIPAMSRAGTYTSTLTVTASAGPDGV